MVENESIIICRLKQALAERHMTMSELSKKSGIDKSIISRYLHNKALPKVSAIEKMSAVLSVSPAWLSGYDVKEPTDGLSSIGIDISKLSESDIDKLVGYYQCLIDSHK